MSEQTNKKEMALKRIATGYHGHATDIRRLAADHLIASHGYDREEFEHLYQGSDDTAAPVADAVRERATEGDSFSGSRASPRRGEYCPQCGEDVDTADWFCRHCGTALDKQREAYDD